MEKDDDFIQDYSSADAFFRDLNREPQNNMKDSNTFQPNPKSNHQADLHPFDTKTLNNQMINQSENVYLPRNPSKRIMDPERRKTYEPGTFDYMKNESSDIEKKNSLRNKQNHASENNYAHQNDKFFFSKPTPNVETINDSDISSENSYDEQNNINDFNSFRWQKSRDQRTSIHNENVNTKTHCNKKTQTPKPKLEIANTIAVDFYYKNIKSFKVDNKSLEFHIYKRTIRPKEPYECNSLNFMSRYLPDVQFQETENNKKGEQNNEKSTVALNIFNNDIEQLWMKTLNRFRSMKSKKAIYDSIRLSEYADYTLTEVVQRDSKAKSIFSQHQIKTFSFSLSEGDYSAFQQKWKSIIDLDLLHIYACYVLSIDLCKVIHDLRSHLYKKHHKSNDSQNETQINIVNGIIHYICQWISLFPNDFSFKADEMANENKSDSIPLKLIDLMDQIIVDFPSHVQIMMDLRSVVYLIYSHEFDPSLFCHFPYLKTTMKDDKNLYFEDLFDLRIQPQILVKHFTYVELSLLAKLKREDLITNIELSESVKSMTKRFDETCSFILSTIVKRNDEQQVDRILYWIEVMNEAMKQRSYQLMFEIENAFSSHTMKNILAKLPDLQFARFDKMRDFLYSKNYDADLSKHKEFCLPFFAMTLNNINQSYIELSNNPNQTIDKFSFFIYQIEFLLDRWGTEYAFGLNSSLLAAIQMLNGKFTSSSDLNNHDNI